MWKRVIIGACLFGIFVACWVALREIPVDVVGQPSATGIIQKDLEQPFFEGLAQSTGLAIKVRYQPNDQLGFRDSHQLPMIRDGELDLVSLRFLQNTHHEPTLLGVDPWGFSTDFETAKKVANVYAPVLDQRLQARFNAKLLGVWPFGPQIFFCNRPVQKLSDIRGLRVRVGNENFSPLIAAFGATPVVIVFEEVRSALASGMVDCAITSAGSGNAAGWAQHASHLFNLGTHFGINGYVINLKLWNRFSKTEQEILEQAFLHHTAVVWENVERVHEEAIRCSTGGPCMKGIRANMKLIEPDAADRRLFQEAFERTTFIDWAARCDQQYSGCSNDWLARVKQIFYSS